MYKLLIVDDSAIQVQSVKNYVNWVDYGITEIKSASNGKDGLEIAKEFKPDIIITDVVMPKMNGIEFAREIEKILTDVKIIFMSCYEDFNYIKEAFDSNAVSYILKPINAEDLNKSICKILDVKETEKWYLSMERLLEESSYTFCENILYRLLYSSNLDNDYLKQTISNLNLDKFNIFAIAKIYISTSFEDYSIYNFFNSVKHRSFNPLKHYPIIESNNVCAIVFMGNTAISNFETLYDSLLEFLNYETHDEILFQAVLSPTFDSLDHAKTISDKVSTYLENCFFTSNSLCVYDEDFEPKAEYNILELKDLISNMIDNPDEKNSDEIFNIYFSEITHSSFSQNKSVCFCIIAIFQIILAERNLLNTQASDIISKMWSEVNEAKNNLDIQSWTKRSIILILEYVQVSEETKYKKIILDIKESINQNYSSSNNIEQLLENIDISISYAKSIFKKYTGITISQFLFEKRMSEAKKLLGDPYIKVYEVAGLVGYKNVRHFSETFKKYYGKTPTEYQQNK